MRGLFGDLLETLIIMSLCTHGFLPKLTEVLLSDGLVIKLKTLLIGHKILSTVLGAGWNKTLGSGGSRSDTFNQMS